MAFGLTNVDGQSFGYIIRLWPRLRGGSCSTMEELRVGLG